MSTTVEEIALAALGDLSEDQANVLNAVRWVNERYAQLCSRRLKHLRRVGEVIIPAAITAGTATVTRDSNIVTVSPAAAAVLTDAVTGRHFLVGINWYRIAAWNPIDLVLMLETPYAEASATASGYKIVQRYVTLNPDAGFLGQFLHTRRRQKITVGSLAELNLIAAERQYMTSGPTFVCEYDEQDGARRVEAYPYSTFTEQMLYVYWERPRSRQLTDAMPSVIEKTDLKEGVLIDVMRMKMAMAAKGGKIEEAALWRNEYRAQETKWERVQQSMVKKDSGVEDLQLMIESRYFTASRLVRNAADEIYARGNRP